MAVVIKLMASNFAKLEKFEGVEFQRWQKKMHLFLSNMSVVYVLTTLMPDNGGDNPTVEQVRKRDDYVYRGLILNGMSDSVFDICQNVETFKELYDTLEAKFMVEDASSKKFLFTQLKMNMDKSIQVSCIIDKLPPLWKDFKHTLKYLKEKLTLVELDSHLCIKKSLGAQDNVKPKGNNVVGPSVVNMVEHNNSSRYNDNKSKRKHHDTKVDPNKKPKVTCWKCGKPRHFKKDCKAGNIGNKANGSGTKGSGDDSSNSLKGQNMFNKSLKVYYVTYVSEAYFVYDDDVSWWVDSGAIVHMLNIVSDNFGSAFMSTSKLNDTILWHARLGHVHFKRMQDMSKDRLIPSFDTETEKCKTCMLTKITKKPFQNVKRKTEVLELIHSDLCDLYATPLLGNKKYLVTFIGDASRAESRVLGGIECIFVGYAEHSKAFRFYVIEPNESVAINSIIKSRDDIFDEHRFSSVPRLSQRSLVKGTEDSRGLVVPEKVNEEDDPKTFDEEMKSQDVALWKEAINDEMDSIMGNNTWLLADLPPGCKPLGCKWIFKRKLKVNETVE
ncbi:zinc finger, CCHC-type containing protein [Tanacetum coccineum]